MLYMHLSISESSNNSAKVLLLAMKKHVPVALCCYDSIIKH